MTEKTLHVVGDGEDQPTAAALLMLWQQHVAGERAPLTLRRYGGALRHFLVWYAEEEGRPLVLADLHPITLAGYRGALQQTAATSTVNTHVCALRAWGAWLHAQGYLPTNPAARLKLVGRQEPAAPRALSPAQVNALLRAAQRTRYPARNTAILQILVQTGLRIGECAALRWDDIAFGEKRGRVQVRAGKGNKARAVPLNDSARQALAEYLASLRPVEPTLKAAAAAWPAVQGGRPTPVWTSERGTPLSVREMSRLVQGLVRDCAARNLAPSDATAHSLRHTFATRYLLTHPHDLVGLARLLGHSALEATRIYVQPTEDDLAARVARIDLNAYGH